MRIAALYDIHGNLPALEAVLDEVHRAGVDRIVVGGDVLPGPMPRRTLDRLQELETPVEFIRGNGEAAVLEHLAGRDLANLREEAREAVQWVAERLRPEDRRLIASWPATVRIAAAGLGEVLFCHATPRSDNEIFTRRTAEDRLLPIFDRLDVPVVVCGHTHMPFDRRVGGTRVVNAGSVGVPFGRTGADWLLLDGDVMQRHNSYDLEAAAERIRSTSYPRVDGFVRRNLLEPPSEAEMIALYSRVEL